MKKLFLSLVIVMLGASLQAQVIDHATHDASMHYGMVDAKGRWVVGPKYIDAAWYDFLQIGVVGNGTVKGAVDNRGRFFLPMEYVQLNGCKRGHSIIAAKKVGEAVCWGILKPVEGETMSTEVMVDFIYNELVFSRRDGLYRAKRADGSFDWLDLDGKVVADHVPAEMPKDDFPHLRERQAQKAQQAEEAETLESNRKLMEEELDLNL